VSEGFTVTPAALTDFSRWLRAGRQRLESVGASTPATPDGGDCGPLIADLLAHLVADAGRLSSELGAAADQIDRSNEEYRAADLASAEVIRSLVGPV
jgi:NAD(P)H-nitrite reductase large subunit